MTCVEMDDVRDQLRKFHISESTGFLLNDPLTELPAYFQPWNLAAKEMPALVAEKKMRDVVAKMERLDHNRLAAYEEYRLAHLQLALIASGYIWQEGDKGVPNVLPECVAVPWCGVSDYLGIKPIICHCSLALANWGWAPEDDCLKCLYSLPGGKEADWFITVTIQIEMEFAKSLQHVIMAMDNAEQENVDGLIENLNRIAEIVQKMEELLFTMHDRLSARTFYDVVRPFLSGWGGEGSPLPNGLVYDGVSDSLQKLKGASAAQSSTLPCLDALLGVSHQPDTWEFLKEMRGYMPQSHKEFINWIENRSIIKPFVTSQWNGRLSSAYNDCVNSVVDFRSYHIQVVAKYIIMMANESNRIQKFEALATKGTGGSDLLPFLKTLRSSTLECLTHKPEETKQVDGDSLTHKPEETKQVDGDSLTHRPEETKQVDGDSLTHRPEETKQVDGDSLTHKPEETKQVDGDSLNHKTEETKQVDGDSAKSLT